MSRIHLVQGDTRPIIYLQLHQPAGPLDISTAMAVLLRVRDIGQSLVLFELTGELLPGTLQADLVQADLSQYPTPGSGGRVRFMFQPGNLSLAAGRYLGEVEVVYGPDNSFSLFPRLDMRVREDF
jgi:hypothetical protein